jgi:hypothetical protein
MAAGPAEPRPVGDADAPRHQAGTGPWLKLAALVLVLAALGLPLNDLFRYAILVAATVLIVTGQVTVRGLPWLGAAAAVGICVLGQIWLAAPRIEEGHNVFLVDQGGGALAAGLPSQVFGVMAAEFDAKYPPERRCDPAAFGCWRGQKFPDRPFAFSADGIHDRAAYSRRVTGIDFADPVWLRLGFTNERGYDWATIPDNVERASRDRRFWALLHRWTLDMPWFVMYRFPADFVGSDLCWRGEVLWPGAGDQFETISHRLRQCRTLTPADVGRQIFGIAIAQDPPLAIDLQPSAKIRLRQLLEPALALIASAAVLGLLMTGSFKTCSFKTCSFKFWRLRRAVLPFALIALALVVVFLNDASFIGGVRPFDSGDDGLVYDGFAREMLRKLLAGDLVGALEGYEPVFYFTPGLRYLRAAEHLMFGESYLGYLALVLLLPFLVFAASRRFLPLRWALGLTLIFTAVPIGVVFGSSLVQYVKWAARGFADPAAYIFFLAGFVLLVGRTAAGPRNGFAVALGAGLLFALALFVRPNIAPAAGVLLGGAGLAALWQGQVRRVAGLCIGFLPVLGMALHNWIYGGVFVLFTSTATMAMSMPPSAYLAAFAELLHLQVHGEHVLRAAAQIGGWLAGPSELVAMAPLNAAAIVVLIRVAAWGRADPWLRLTAGATVVQQCVGLFYLTGGRYYYLTWLLTLLVIAAWIHGEGIVLLQRRFPLLTERVAAHPASAALRRALGRMARMLEDGAARGTS